MAENYKLQDVLLTIISDVNLFCKLIKYPSLRENILKTFKVNEKVFQKKTADLKQFDGQYEKYVLLFYFASHIIM